jgi:3-methyladenine DNA glycosylase AlkD
VRILNQKNLINKLKGELIKNSSPSTALILQKFFKTKKGQYGYGDIFLGVKLPDIRKIAKNYFKKIKFSEIKILLYSKLHEERMLALVLLSEKFKNGNLQAKRQVFKFYLKNIVMVNNWDLVDLSAPKILGEYILIDKRQKNVLKSLVQTDSLWAKRIAMVSTFAFIKRGSSKECFSIAALLLGEKEDLLQKALGWMLREVGKRISIREEQQFLEKYSRLMGRTALRYATERFSVRIRQKYLKAKNDI